MVDTDASVRRAERAVHLYSVMLRKIAFTYLKSIPDAEDVVQEVFIAYLRQAPEFTSDGHEKAWLIRVTVNKSIDYMKARRRRNHSELPEYLAELPDDEGHVLAAVLSLDPKYRLPVHLHYYEGYSIEEIAKILKTKPATIGTRLSRGRNLLKEILGGKSYEQ